MIKVQLPLIFLLLFSAFGLWAGDDLNTSLLSAAKAGDAAKVESLLDRGADIEARHDNRETALIWASFEGHAAVVEALLSRGAEIEARDDDRWTALMRAAAYGHAAVVETLLSRGAEIEARDYGGTALMLASTDIAVETLLDLVVLKLRPGLITDLLPLWRASTLT